MDILSLIGHSGSGKTFFIENAVKMLRNELNLECGVIKNVHNHLVDKAGKDSHRFISSGANFTLIKNKFDQFALFFNGDLRFESIIDWIKSGPIKFDVLFLEGFRGLPYPTILCVQNPEEIENQLSKDVKLISGLVTLEPEIQNDFLGIPIIDIKTNFERFVDVFNFNLHTK